FYQAGDSIPSLSALGVLSCAAMTQCAPARIGGMYGRQGNKKGVYVGLAVGLTIWWITLLSQTDMLAGNACNTFLIWLSTPP
ncbi:hypothetical protein NP568_24610, partial [Vibrio parahaemolyticus]|nr:hypothetical protein [Vibrio parahaemolyticus]